MHAVKDKVFLITGGASGIGAGVTRAVLNEGAKHVAVLDVNVSNGKSLKAELAAKHGQKMVKFYKCDVTTQELENSYDAVVKEFGYIDCVVNAAGILNDGPKAFVKEIEINVTAVIRSSLKAYNLMRKERGGKGGTIINISSIAGIVQCTPIPVYCATKSAVLQFSNCLGMTPHYPRSNVRVLTLCFGCTDTALLKSENYAHIDKETDADQGIEGCLAAFPMQTCESAVKGVLEAYKKGASASTWLVSANLPAKDITENIKKAYEIMCQGILDK